MVDAAFAGVGKSPGLDVWRIEKLKVVPIEKKQYGKFYTGDSYIVLDTKRKQFGTEWNIHFWLGEETSQDEAGTAAIKSVELDDSLGGAPVQHREVQGHESKKFISLFPNGIQYLSGGIESGFMKVEKDKYEPRLLHVKGRRNIRVWQTHLAWYAMNSGDCFILDLGLTLYVWNGSGAGLMEKRKALDVARRIRDEERGGRAAMEIMEENEMNPEFVKTMNGIAEGTPKDIAEATDDITFERVSKEKVKLYRVSDATGSLEITEVGSYPLSRELLDSNDAFILDTGAGGLFAWLGKKATQQERKAAFKNALDFIQQKKYPNWTHVTTVREGAETPLFKQNFIKWVGKDEVTALPTARTTAAPKVQPKFDINKMHTKGSRESQHLVDDGSGKVQVWRIEDFEMAEVDEKMHGQFFGGDSYVILYTYILNNKENYIIYFWQGQESSTDERSAAALHAVHLDDQYGGAPVQIRVVQGKEPDHFLLVFKGRMVVHSGGRASAFKNRFDQDSYDVDGTRLFHVRGTNEFDTRAVQVEEKASSLNSNDCFVLETPNATYIWYGKGCSGDERQLADSLASSVSPGREPVKVTEGSEPEEFWTSLGGKTEYGSGKWLEEVVPTVPPRLFQCSNASGRFNVEEIFDFAQEDLVQEDVMILDTYAQVFVWVGRDANEVEKREALKTAKEYIESDPSGRDLDSTQLLQVKQGFEPPIFTCHFLGWNPNLWAQDKSYEAYKKEVQQGVTSVKDELAKYDPNKKYPYEQLKGSGNCPVGVDPSNKEVHLTEEEFSKVFGMSIHDYRPLPQWKKNNLKKKVDLF